MTSFATTPGNTRHDVLRNALNSPMVRVQRIIQVTRSYWWPSVEPARPALPLIGPGGRSLKRNRQGVS